MYSNTSPKDSDPSLTLDKGVELSSELPPAAMNLTSAHLVAQSLNRDQLLGWYLLVDGTVEELLESLRFRAATTLMARKRSISVSKKMSTLVYMPTMQRVLQLMNLLSPKDPKVPAIDKIAGFTAILLSAPDVPIWRMVA